MSFGAKKHTGSVLCAIVACLISACGAHGSKSAIFEGTGVVEKFANIDFNGLVLNDRSNGQIFTLSNEVELDQVGLVITYAGDLSAEPSGLAGQPPKLTFVKYEVIGVIN